MNRYVKFMTLLLTIIAVSFACSSSPNFAGIMNKDWNLVTVRGSAGNITFNRGKLAEEGFSDIFTLRFDQERINGVGALNQYLAPYTLADKQGITIDTIVQTKMAPLHEPEYLKEQDFIAYLQNTNKWGVVKGNLELQTTGSDGAAVVLVFAP